MDLDTVEELVVPLRRDELPAWRPGDAVIAGGTWLFSEAQPDLRRLIDITAMGWAPYEIRDGGLELAATCTVEQLSRLSGQLPPDWTAAPLLHQCCTALLASFKIWKTATIGGNVCLSLPAGSIISLATALDGVATVWRADRSQYTVGITDFVTGAATNVLGAGDIVRSIFLPAAALRGKTAYRKIALAPLGRSGAVLVGRLDRPGDGGTFALAVTGSTTRPVSLRFAGLPTTAELDDALDGIPAQLWHADAHGTPDWRRAMSAVLARQIRAELQ